MSVVTGKEGELIPGSEESSLGQLHSRRAPSAHLRAFINNLDARFFNYVWEWRKTGKCYVTRIGILVAL